MKIGENRLSNMLSKKLFLTFALSAGLTLGACAEILMHEGFPGGATGYKDTTGTGDLKSRPITTNAVVGFSATTWQNSGTTAVYDMGLASGLTLPASFSGLPSAAYQGSNSAGLKNSASSSDERLQWKPLTSGLLNRQSGTIAFRFLMSADSTALNAHVSGTDLTANNYYGAGLVLDGSIQNSSIRTTTGRALCFVFRKDASGQHLSFVLKDGNENRQIYDLLVPVAGTTYLCYAEISVNDGTDAKERVRVFAQDVASYDPGAAFFQYSGSDVFEAQLIDATTWPTHLVLGGHYGTNNGTFKVDEFALATDPDDIMVIGVPGAPKLEACALVKEGGNYGVTGIVTKASATTGVIAQDDAGNVLRTMSLSETDEDDPFSVTFAETFLTNTTYRLSAIATNDVGAVTNAVGTIYSGELSITKVKDADEYKCVPGEVTVSRADADDLDLVVYYSFASLVGTEGTDWEVPSGWVTIPAGSASATIYLTPKVNAAITADYAVTLTLALGNYAVPSPATVDLTIKNLVSPAGYNTWVAAADGQASASSNWSEGRVPNSTDNILFDGDISNASCEWDGATLNGPSSTVASWTQNAEYTGTVTIGTLYPEVVGATFTNFTATGNMAVSGGKITQVANAIQKEEYRLRLSVGGNLTVTAPGLIDVSAKGPRGVMTGRTENTYGGDAGTFGKTFGDPKRPYSCGIGNDGNWSAYYKSAGGGAAWIEVGGAVSLSGSIRADGGRFGSSVTGELTSGGNIGTSGGSVYLKAASLSGTGTIQASAIVSGDNKAASGGRIAVELTGADNALPLDNIKAWADTGVAGHCGVGTIVVKNPGQANGTLIVRGNPLQTFSYNSTLSDVVRMTSMPPGSEWTFDAIVFGDFGQLVVPSGCTLNLPNGFASVSASNLVSNANSLYASGLLVRGGTVNAPTVSAKHTFGGGKWTFHPASNHVFNADVVVKEGANLGTLALASTVANAYRCWFTVNGNLTVESTGVMRTENGGIGGNGTAQDAGGFIAYPFGKAWGTGHGGQNGMCGSINNAYGSFFSPVLPGTPGGYHDFRYVGGGAIVATVSGTLTVDGAVSSGSATSVGRGSGWSSRAPAPGSINLTAGSLAGSGTITANGASGKTSVDSNSYGASGGGRIAVRLTGTESTFSDSWKDRILAKGYTYTSNLANPTNSASAGSVYLQTAAQPEKGGTIIIRNDGVAGNLAWTPVPSAAQGDSAADFKQAALLLAACGKARLFETLQAESLSMESGTALDLAGMALTLRSMQAGGENVPAGTYAAGSTLFTDGFVTDSVGGGSVVVLGAGTVVVIR